MTDDMSHIFDTVKAKVALGLSLRLAFTSLWKTFSRHWV